MIQKDKWALLVGVVLLFGSLFATQYNPNAASAMIFMGIMALLMGLL